MCFPSTYDCAPLLSHAGDFPPMTPSLPPRTMERISIKCHQSAMPSTSYKSGHEITHPLPASSPTRLPSPSPFLSHAGNARTQGSGRRHDANLLAHAGHNPSRACSFFSSSGAHNDCLFTSALLLRHQSCPLLFPHSLFSINEDPPPVASARLPGTPQSPSSAYKISPSSHPP
jgi:hypothetical protein